MTPFFSSTIYLNHKTTSIKILPFVVVADAVVDFAALNSFVVTNWWPPYDFVVRAFDGSHVASLVCASVMWADKAVILLAMESLE